jgi:hypothetical protein
MQPVLWRGCGRCLRYQCAEENFFAEATSVFSLLFSALDLAEGQTGGWPVGQTKSSSPGSGGFHSCSSAGGAQTIRMPSWYLCTMRVIANNAFDWQRGQRVAESPTAWQLLQKISIGVRGWASEGRGAGRRTGGWAMKALAEVFAREVRDWEASGILGTASRRKTYASPCSGFAAF